MLHFILAVLSLTVFAVISLPVIPAMYIIRTSDPEAAGRMSQSWIRIGCRLLLFAAGCKVTVLGGENIPQDAPVLFVSNHRGVFDIVVAYGFTEKRFAFVAKKEARALPFVGFFIELAGGLFLDRSDIKKGMQTILDAIERVKSGLSVWICPEGTRTTGKDITQLLPFKNGSFKIASKPDICVIPVAMTGTRETFEAHIPFVIPQKLVIEYGRPERISQLPEEDRKDPGEHFRTRIITMLERSSQNHTTAHQAGKTI